MQFFFWAKFRQISTWRIRFQTIKRVFREKNGPNSPDFEDLFSESPDVDDNFQ